MSSDDQWHRIRFPKDELRSGAVRRFLVNILLGGRTTHQSCRPGHRRHYSAWTIPKVVNTCISRPALFPRSSPSPWRKEHSLAIVQFPEALSSTATSGLPAGSSRRDFIARPARAQLGWFSRSLTGFKVRKIVAISGQLVASALKPVSDSQSAARAEPGSLERLTVGLTSRTVFPCALRPPT